MLYYTRFMLPSGCFGLPRLALQRVLYLCYAMRQFAVGFLANAPLLKQVMLCYP